MSITAANVAFACKVCLKGEASTFHKLDSETFFDYMISPWEALKLLCPGVINLKDDDCIQPTKICNSCYQKFKIAFDFQQQVNQTDNELRSLIEGLPEDTYTQSVEFHEVEEGEINEDIGPLPLEVIKEERGEEVLEEVEEPPYTIVESIEVPVEELEYMNEEEHEGECDDDEEEEFILHKTEGASEDELLAKLRQSMNKSKDFSAPEGSKIVYVNNHKHFQCLQCRTVYDRRDKAILHVKSCNRTPIDESLLPEMTEEKILDYNVMKVSKPRKPKSGEFRCPTCDKIFATRNTLKTHMKRHDGSLPYPCPCCSMSFAYKLVLERHMRSHTGEKKFFCDVCEKGFATKAGVDLHRRLHFGELPFPCESCGKRFNSKSNLKIHIRTHTGEKPYKCKVCEKAYAGSNDLAKHMKKHFGEYMYGCDYCDEKFRTQTEVRRHAVIHALEDGAEIQVEEEIN